VRGDVDAEEFIERTRRIAREHLVAIATSGTPGRVNRPLLNALAEHGLLQLLFPESVGGMQPGSVSATHLCLLREALACECVEAETALALQGLGSYGILQSGRPEVVARWLPPVCRGEAVAAFALSEPEAGSDAGALTLRAEPDRGGYRLTGTKLWISNAPEADIYTVFARTTEGAGAHGVSAFAVPGDSAGLTGNSLEMISPHPIGRLDFEGVPVPESHLLGERDSGFRVAMQTLDLFRPSVGAFAVGMAQAALDVALEHAATRQAFGRPLLDMQAVAHRLADMATLTHAARLMVRDAATAYDAQAPYVTARSAMAKLHATESAQQVVDGAVQILGARALQQGHLLEHLYREVRGPRIYEGASEVQRSIIARHLSTGRSGC
jgi:acyl-CoA dehydrogenase